MKKIMPFLSSALIVGAIGASSVSAAEKEVNLCTVSNGNVMLSDENGYMMFENEREIYAYNRNNFTLTLIAEENTEITNELLEISNDYEIEKSNNVYTIYFETEEEMNELFEKSSEWNNDGIIKNAYKKMNMQYYCVLEREDNTVTACTVAHAAPQITYLIYNEEDVIGDSNGDGEVTASDAAYIAKELAEQNVNALDYRADFNNSTDVTALDAASIANYLAQKSISE